jgi:hypothetical protein
MSFSLTLKLNTSKSSVYKINWRVVEIYTADTINISDWWQKIRPQCPSLHFYIFIFKQIYIFNFMDNIAFKNISKTICYSIPHNYYFWDDFYSFFLQMFLKTFLRNNILDPMPLIHVTYKRKLLFLKIFDIFSDAVIFHRSRVHFLKRK